MQEPGGQAGTGRFNISIHRRGRGYPTSGRADGARLRFSLPLPGGNRGLYLQGQASSVVSESTGLLSVF